MIHWAPQLCWDYCYIWREMGDEGNTLDTHTHTYMYTGGIWMKWLCDVMTVSIWWMNASCLTFACLLRLCYITTYVCQCAAPNGGRTECGSGWTDGWIYEGWGETVNEWHWRRNKKSEARDRMIRYMQVGDTCLWARVHACDDDGWYGCANN